jgi:hypothetical protein
MKTRKYAISEQVKKFLAEQNPAVDGLRLFGPRSRHWQEDKLEKHQQRIQKQEKQMPFVGHLEPHTERTSSVEPEEPTSPDTNIPPKLYKKEVENYLRSKYTWNTEKDKTERFQNISRPLYSSK